MKIIGLFLLQKMNNVWRERDDGEVARMPIFKVKQLLKGKIYEVETE